MKRRQNGILGTSVSVGLAATLGVGGWVAFRLYVRDRLAEKLEKEGLSEMFHTAGGVAGVFGIDLNLPSSIAVAKSAVPIWSTVMPKTALRDISENGRQSQYWPDEYRQANPLVAAFGVEEMAFKQLGEAVG